MFDQRCVNSFHPQCSNLKTKYDIINFMANLSAIEKMKLEKIFSMSGGYVLNFGNNSFSRFIYDSVKINIDEPKYEKYGSSKANRLRTFWELEGNVTVGKLTEDMLLAYR